MHMQALQKTDAGSPQMHMQALQGGPQLHLIKNPCCRYNKHHQEHLHHML